MRVALVGDFAKDFDEGLKNIAKYTANEVAKRHEVRLLDLRETFQPSFWKSLREFQPDVIHYLVGNTPRGLVLAALMRSFTGVPVVSSINHPGTSVTLRGESAFRAQLLKPFQPDLVLTQAERTEALLAKIGWRFSSLGNGVDLEKFTPAPAARETVRANLGVDEHETMVLHVGHITTRRNLEALIPVQEQGAKVVVLASRYQGIDTGVQQRLENAGCIIRYGYVENLPDFFSAADVYAFPVLRHQTIQMPLSVLEAMACNVRVVTVPHEGLSHFFEGGNGLRFSEPEHFPHAISEVLKDPVETRQQVLPFSLSEIGDALDQHYRSVLKRGAS